MMSPVEGITAFKRDQMLLKQELSDSVHIARVEDDRKLVDTLRAMMLECSGRNRRFVIGRDTLVRLQRLRDINGAFLVDRDWTTLLGLPVDLSDRAGRVGITCDAP